MRNMKPIHNKSGICDLCNKEIKEKLHWQKFHNHPNPWNKGLSKETDERIKKISISKRGHNTWNKGLKGKEYLNHYKYGHPKGMLGKHHTEETKRKRSTSELGPKNPAWKGGKSFEPYTSEFNIMLKEQIRQRDNWTCQICGFKQNGIKLDIHHIDYNKNNVNPSNLITLCHKCHSRTNSNHRNFWMNYFNNKGGGINSRG